MGLYPRRSTYHIGHIPLVPKALRAKPPSYPFSLRIACFQKGCYLSLMAPYAAITFVYKSYPFLRKWVEYYGGLFGRKNLFIISHGDDPVHRVICEGCNIIQVPRDFNVEFDIVRWRFLSLQVSSLLEYFDWVLCIDCDELIIADPRYGMSVCDVLQSSQSSVLAPIGYHLLGNESAGEIRIDWARPLLEQFNVLIFDASYCKPVIVSKPVTFYPGGHGVSDTSFVHHPALILVHLKYLDYNRIVHLAREYSQDLIDQNAKVRGKMSYIWKSGMEGEKSRIAEYQKRPVLSDENACVFCANAAKKTKLSFEDGEIMQPTHARHKVAIAVPERLRSLV